MKKLLLLTVLLLTVVTTMAATAAPLAPPPSSPLSEQTLATTIGSSCARAWGLMTGFAFLSGYTVAACPPASLALLGAASAVGVGILILC